MTVSDGKFETGRHETFQIRYGWIGKALARAAAGGYRGDLADADALGIGSRMAKGLAYWIGALGVATPIGSARDRIFVPTEMGRVLLRHDPTLEYPAAWWFAHVMLASREASIWSWYFATWRHVRTFDRAECVAALCEHLSRSGSRTSVKSVQREVACLLSTYAGDAAAADPEDATACPMRDLGLLTHCHDGRFARRDPRDPPPPEAMCAAAALVADAGGGDIPLAALVGSSSGPALFQMDADAMADALSAAAQSCAGDGVTITLLGGERHLHLPVISPAGWLERHYIRIQR